MFFYYLGSICPSGQLWCRGGLPVDPSAHLSRSAAATFFFFFGGKSNNELNGQTNGLFFFPDEHLLDNEAEYIHWLVWVRVEFNQDMVNRMLWGDVDSSKSESTSHQGFWTSSFWSRVHLTAWFIDFKFSVRHKSVNAIVFVGGTYQAVQCMLGRSCVTTCPPSPPEEQASTVTFTSFSNRMDPSTSRRMSGLRHGEHCTHLS